MNSEGFGLGELGGVAVAAKQARCVSQHSIGFVQKSSHFDTLTSPGASKPSEFLFL